MTDGGGTARPEFTLRRIVAAPREVVWRLWTDPAELARWLHPRGMRVRPGSVSVDLRVGGRFRYTMVDDAAGAEYPSGGEYLEIVEPERLVFTWMAPDEPVDPVATVALRDLGGRTEIVFHLRGLAGRPGDGHVHDGWSDSLDHLASAAA